jgi:hypothetical protein
MHYNGGLELEICSYYIAMPLFQFHDRIQFSSGQFLPAIRFREQGNHKITALVLENIPMVMAPWSEHTEGDKHHLFIDVIRQAVSPHYLLYELLLNSAPELGDRELGSHAGTGLYRTQLSIVQPFGVECKTDVDEVISEPRVSPQSILSRRGDQFQRTGTVYNVNDNAYRWFKAVVLST